MANIWESSLAGFNSQPPEGGWGLGNPALVAAMKFQLTAARRRLAHLYADWMIYNTVSTHSRPKAAGTLANRANPLQFCFNSQPPEGGWAFKPCNTANKHPFQLTAARRRLAASTIPPPYQAWFQLTAARRRLAQAGEVLLRLYGFNSQPPEGGWKFNDRKGIFEFWFQLTAARRRLVKRTGT